jgi:hypothetical protein
MRVSSGLYSAASAAQGPTALLAAGLLAALALAINGGL